MPGIRLKVRVEIVQEEEEQDGATVGASRLLDDVEQEVCRVVDEQCAGSLDDFEEVLLNSSYEAMRAVLSKHFEQVSKRGRCERRPTAG